MNTIDFRNYLSLLHDLTKTLAQLTEIENRKLLASRDNELTVLNECMNQEQALTLALRGYEQKQQAALVSLQLVGTALSELPQHAPADCAEEAQETVQTLQEQYRIFKDAFDSTEKSLRSNLYQVEKVLTDIGSARSEGAGYEEPSAQPPESMRTDFRA